MAVCPLTPPRDKPHRGLPASPRSPRLVRRTSYNNANPGGARRHIFATLLSAVPLRQPAKGDAQMLGTAVKTSSKRFSKTIAVRHAVLTVVLGSAPVFGQPAPAAP